MKKIVLSLLIAVTVLFTSTVVLLILWQSNKNYSSILEEQITERNKLINIIYNERFVLDKGSLQLLETIFSNDSVTSGSMLPHKIEDSERRLIYNIAKNYKRIIENKDIQGYVDLFPDTVARFFLKESVPNSQIYNEMGKYWKSHPDVNAPKYILDDMQIVKKPSEYIIYLPSESNETEYITEIRLNKSLKIFYIRDFYGYVSK